MRSLSKEYKYNFFIRIILESYLECWVLSLLNIRYPKFESISQILSVGIACLLIAGCLFMAVWTLIFLKRKYSDIKKGLLEDVAGTVIVLFEDYKLTKWSLLFNVFFFFRRFIYAAIIIFAVDYLLIQAIFFVTLMAILFLYTAIVRPFKLKVISFFMIFNEGVLVALGISNFLFLKPITSKSKDFMLGWVCIAVIIGAICLNLLYLIFVQIKSIVTIVRRLCNKTANGSKSGEK